MSYRSKYKAKKTIVDGIEFDSKKEADRYRELVLLERAGQIQNLRRQVKYVLIPAIYAPDIVGVRGGRKRGKVIERECSYIADFVYEVPFSQSYENSDGHVVFADGFETIVEDTKSEATKTKDYIIKRKLMLYRFGIRIKEV